MGNVRLQGSVQAMRESLVAQLVKGRAIQELPRERQSEVDEYRRRFLSWNEYVSSVLKSSFDVHGTTTVSPANEFGSSDIAVMALKLGVEKPNEEVIAAIDPVLDEKIRVLESIADRLEIWSDAEPAPELERQGEDIFLVHGRDLGARESVRGFLERVTQRTVIVLDETAGGGNDILGKLLAQAQRAAFAVVLLTGDDQGSLAADQAFRLRARQNVILELGLFIGLLGRDRVVALYQEGVEIPSDYLGVSYIPLDQSVGWQMHLTRELRSAGIDASLDKIL